MRESNGNALQRTKEAEFYYLQAPSRFRPVRHKIDFLPVTQFLEDEETCKEIWELLCCQFKTRSKFLAIWQSVRFVAVHGRGSELSGFLFVSAPLNWQIDYVVVRPSRRHEGIAAALVNETLNQALARNVPYVMLTSREDLRPLYEKTCGFSIVGGRGIHGNNGDFHSLALSVPVAGAV